jgi:hypothetical protein
MLEEVPVCVGVPEILPSLLVLFDKFNPGGKPADPVANDQLNDGVKEPPVVVNVSE